MSAEQRYATHASTPDCTRIRVDLADGTFVTLPRELPAMPPELDEVRVFMGDRSDDNARWANPDGYYYSADQMRAYAIAYAGDRVAQLIEAGKALSFAAQITGGTAGPDPGLQTAIQRFSAALDGL